jgi:hypothetical protein
VPSQEVEKLRQLRQRVIPPVKNAVHINDEVLDVA